MLQCYFCMTDATGGEPEFWDNGVKIAQAVCPKCVKKYLKETLHFTDAEGCEHTVNVDEVIAHTFKRK